MSAEAWVVAAVLVAALVFGLARAASDGRFRGTHRVKGAAETGSELPRGVLSGTDIDAVLGERATFLQFSSAFCAPCRATRRVLGEVAMVVPGVAHVDVDAEHHLDLVRQLGVVRTPTTLLLDSAGRELTRATGAVRKDQALAVLSASLD